MSIKSIYRSKPVPKSRINPRINSRGREVLDPVSSVAPIGFRPLTDFERLQRLTLHGMRVDRFLPDDEFTDEEDFHDHLDDVPDEGLTPYEIAEIKPKASNNLVQKVLRKAAPPPPPAEEGASGDAPLAQ